jgi:hypothetical protein
MKRFTLLVSLLAIFLPLNASTAEASAGSWPRWGHRNHSTALHSTARNIRDSHGNVGHTKKLKSRSHPGSHHPKTH